MAIPPIQLMIAVNMQQLNANLQQVNQSISDLTNQMGQSFARNLGGGARLGGAAVGSLAGDLRGLKAEMVSVSRTSYFLARDVGMIIPLSNDARMSVAALIGVFAAGSTVAGVFQVLISSIGTIIRLYDEWKDEQLKLQHLSAQFHEELGIGLKDLIDSFGAAQNAGTKAWHSMIKPEEKEVKDAVQDVQDYGNSISMLARHFGELYIKIMEHASLGGGAIDKWIGKLLPDFMHINTVAEEGERRLQKARIAIQALNDALPLRFAAEQNAQMNYDRDRDARIETMKAAHKDRLVQIEVEARNKIQKLNAENTIMDPKAVEIKAVEAKRDADIREEKRRRAYEDSQFYLRLQEVGADEEMRIELQTLSKILEIREKRHKMITAAQRAETQRQTDAELKAGVRLVEELNAKADAKRIADIKKTTEEELKIELKWTEEYFKLQDEVAAYDESLSKRKLTRQLEHVNVQASSMLTKMHKLEEDELEITNKMYADGEISEEQHQAKLLEIQRKFAKRKKELDKETADARAEVEAAWAMPFIDSLTKNWEKGFDQMMMGTYSWANFTKNLYHSLAQAISSQLSQMAAEWVKHELIKVAASRIATLEIVATAAWGAIQTGAIAVAEGLKFVAIKAWEAAAAAYASIAAIPFIGPFLAPVMAAAALAAVIGLGAHIASAAGGMDVGSRGTFAVLHPQEMVLPAGLATSVREMAGGGGSGRPVSIHINAVDASGFEDMLTRNQGSLLKIIREGLKNNRF